MKYIIVIISVFIMAGCAGRKISDQPISENERLFRSKCSTCHRLPDIDKFAAGKWKLTLSKHSDRLKLDQKQVDAILLFLSNDSAKHAAK